MIESGNRFGKLVVIERAGSTGNGRSLWKCQCDCGNVVIVRGNHLIEGNTKSCGCLSLENLQRANYERSGHMQYGKDAKRLRNIRESMIKRCTHYDRNDYKYYGGRGIAVCAEWMKSFKEFYKWAVSNGYQENLTIDRINNDGNYEPSNCRWVTMKEQNKHRRNCN